MNLLRKIFRSAKRDLRSDQANVVSVGRSIQFAAGEAGGGDGANNGCGGAGGDGGAGNGDGKSNVLWLTGIDNPVTAASNLADGNYDSLDALMHIANQASSIDPRLSQPSRSGLCLQILNHADELRLYDDKAALLFYGICGEDAGKAITIIQAATHGVISSQELHHNIEMYSKFRVHNLDVDRICHIVQNTVHGYARVVADEVTPQTGSPTNFRLQHA